MTANILTAGHIYCLDLLSKKYKVVVGLLSKKALRGYKKEVVPFPDRLKILQTLARAYPNVSVVEQNSLNPGKKIRGFNYLASGDGFEAKEIRSAKRYGVKLLYIKLKHEKTKRYSSSKILNGTISNKVGH